jgi:hypothetical protein
MNIIKNIELNKIRLPILVCISLFFFIIDIRLILTGGGWIATINQPFHWLLLYLEIIIALLTSCFCFYLFFKKSLAFKKPINRDLLSFKMIIILIVTILIIHLIRVGFWIQNRGF